MTEYKGIEYTKDSTLPSVGLCALMAYEYLKHGGMAETALAWATLGTLVLSIPDRNTDNATELAVRVAEAAHAVAVENTDQNRLTLQKSLQDWIDATA